MDMFTNGLVIAAVVVVAFAVASSILEWLWNITMPQAFRLPPITFWIAFRLILIGSLISGGGFVRFNF
jgi:hypothetical protein